MLGGSSESEMYFLLIFDYKGWHDGGKIYKEVLKNDGSVKNINFSQCNVYDGKRQTELSGNKAQITEETACSVREMHLYLEVYFFRKLL